MHHVNVEIKSRCDDLSAVRQRLQARDPRFVGEDHQVDTYFQVDTGRLKLREGTLERALIYYRRPDQDGPKTSDIRRYEPAESAPLKAVLKAALGVWVVVDKRREIYFLDNVKFHLDRVDRLGTFVEIEAIGEDASADQAALREQCARFQKALGLADEDLVARSYSDLVAEQA
jgi:predicted adenylyl cyclase CyaB